MRAARVPAVMLALGGAAVTRVLADEPSANVVWACETQSTVVAPEAASSSGKIKLQTPAAPSANAVWRVVEGDQAHMASFVRLYTACAAGCEAQMNASKPVFELWAPKKGPPSAMPAGVPLSVATLDPATGQIRVSTFVDNAIAALEQGTCQKAP